MICMLIVAILAMTYGHLMKINRWMQYIQVYEEPDKQNLCRALAIGQVVNTFIPFRMGDVIRVIYSGRKMHNGYSFSLATILADLYIDFVTVSFMLFGISLINRGGESIFVVSKYYAILFLVVAIVTAVCIIFRSQVKKTAAYVFSFFNERIEFRLLYVFYLFIASIKDIIYRIKKRYFILFTILMWVGYLISYAMFAEVVQSTGEFYSMSMVFEHLFSGNAVYYMPATLLSLFFIVTPSILIFLGSFFCKKKVDKSESRKVLPQLTKQDRMAFLKTYYADTNRDHVQSYLEINKDVIVIQDNSAGSNASTVIIMKNEEMYFRKYAFDSDGKKLTEQIEWIEDHQGDIPLPAILGKNISDRFASYDMHKWMGAVGFFQYIHTNPVEQSWGILRKALDDLRSGVHTKNVRSCDEITIQKYIDTKIQHNIEIIKNDNRYIRNLEKNDTIIVNGRKLPTLRHFENMFGTSHLKEIFGKDTYSDLHGDLTIENIVCLLQKKDILPEEFKGKVLPDDYYFIDPNTGNLHESPFLDYAKLLQSLHGNYEFLMMVRDVDIHRKSVSYMTTKSEVYGQIYHKFHEYLTTTFSNEQVMSIYYHEIVHWLRLMPYKIRKDEKLAVVFYTGLLQVLDDVEQMERGTKL